MLRYKLRFNSFLSEALYMGIFLWVLNNDFFNFINIIIVTIIIIIIIIIAELSRAKRAAEHHG